MHYNTKHFQIVLFNKRFYINTEGFPRTGDYRKAVVKWAFGLGLFEIRRWGWIRKDLTSVERPGWDHESSPR